MGWPSTSHPTFRCDRLETILRAEFEDAVARVVIGDSKAGSICRRAADLIERKLQVTVVIIKGQQPMIHEVKR